MADETNNSNQQSADNSQSQEIQRLMDNDRNSSFLARAQQQISSMASIPQIAQLSTTPVELSRVTNGKNSLDFRSVAVPTFQKIDMAFTKVFSGNRVLDDVINNNFTQVSEVASRIQSEYSQATNFLYGEVVRIDNNVQLLGRNFDEFSQSTQRSVDELLRRIKAIELQQENDIKFGAGVQTGSSQYGMNNGQTGGGFPWWALLLPKPKTNTSAAKAEEEARAKAKAEEEAKVAREKAAREQAARDQAARQQLRDAETRAPKFDPKAAGGGRYRDAGGRFVSKVEAESQIRAAQEQIAEYERVRARTVTETSTAPKLIEVAPKPSLGMKAATGAVNVLGWLGLIWAGNEAFNRVKEAYAIYEVDRDSTKLWKVITQESAALGSGIYLGAVIGGMGGAALGAPAGGVGAGPGALIGSTTGGIIGFMLGDAVGKVIVGGILYDILIYGKPIDKAVADNALPYLKSFLVDNRDHPAAIEVTLKRIRAFSKNDEDFKKLVYRYFNRVNVATFMNAPDVDFFLSTDRKKVEDVLRSLGYNPEILTNPNANLRGNANTSAIPTPDRTIMDRMAGRGTGAGTADVATRGLVTKPVGTLVASNDRTGIDGLHRSITDTSGALVPNISGFASQSHDSTSDSNPVEKFSMERSEIGFKSNIEMSLESKLDLTIKAKTIKLEADSLLFEIKTLGVTNRGVASAVGSDPSVKDYAQQSVQDLMNSILGGGTAIGGSGGGYIPGGGSGAGAGGASAGGARSRTGGGGSLPMGSSTARGVRNNNPGNIRDGKFARSMPGYVGSDGAFAIFDSPDSGRNAQMRLLSGKGYWGGGRNTIASIISKWAPSGDGNNVSAYAMHVARATGIDPNQVLTKDQLELVAAAMSGVELGFNNVSKFYSDVSLPGISTNMGGGKAEPGKVTERLLNDFDPKAFGGSGQQDLVALGNVLQGEGFRVSENPAFGGVSPVHRGAGHYENRAFDLNVGSGVYEANDPVAGAKFDALAKQFEQMGLSVIWRRDGHFNHMHVEIPEGMDITPQMIEKIKKDAQALGMSVQPTAPKPAIASDKLKRTRSLSSTKPQAQLPYGAPAAVKPEVKTTIPSNNYTSANPTATNTTPKKPVKTGWSDMAQAGEDAKKQTFYGGKLVPDSPSIPAPKNSNDYPQDTAFNMERSNLCTV